ncbi:flavodoxin [Mitsuokella sp.]|uniref:flavodoxin n=1 Tax=Mitsuokella TaxID=52225 RepID=UPI0029E26450|nr:flavodoxin [Mitsuokella sp.]MDD6382992.1 flavodoxin [Selenomonadaceae bacterium]MDY4475115.1 flavodoxin [Mitsuokella sp.]
MSKVAVIYWSGTGNTEAMAQSVKAGAEKAGAAVDLFELESFPAGQFADYDAFLFGCPAMGNEELEESAYEPFFASIEDKLSGVPVGLFGSYGWGGGAWMEEWAERVRKDGAKLIGDGLAIENAPADEDLAKCEALGQEVAAAI